jgi:hypothetical protein
MITVFHVLIGIAVLTVLFFALLLNRVIRAREVKKNFTPDVINRGSETINAVLRGEIMLHKITNDLKEYNSISHMKSYQRFTVQNEMFNSIVNLNNSYQDDSITD